MRFTLSQMRRAIQIQLKRGKINELIEGYPLLHRVLMEMRDARKSKDREEWYDLFRVLVRSKQVDLNVRDQHGSTPLHWAVREFNPELSSRIIYRLLHTGADPEAVDGYTKITAFELAIERYPADHEIVQQLQPVTTMTSTLRQRCQEMFDETVDDVKCGEINDDEAIQRIEALLDLKLAKAPELQMVGRKQEPSWFTKGVWVRTIDDPEKEMQILRKRQGLHGRKLRGCQFKDDSYYTRESSMTFLRGGVPTATFGHECGVMVLPKGRTIRYFYDGQHGEELTRTMHLAGLWPRQASSDGCGHHHLIHERDLPSVVKKAYRYKRPQGSESPVDKYGVLAGRDWPVPWNEGLLRYRHDEIHAVFVTSLTKEALEKAQTFRKQMKLGHETPLYLLRTNIGTVVPLSWPKPKPTAAHTAKHRSRLHHQERRSQHAAHMAASRRDDHRTGHRCAPSRR